MTAFSASSAYSTVCSVTATPRSLPRHLPGAHLPAVIRPARCITPSPLPSLLTLRAHALASYPGSIPGAVMIRACRSLQDCQPIAINSVP